MEVRKLHFNKSSFVLTLPKQYVKQLGLKHGDLVKLDMPELDTISLQPLQPILAKGKAAKAKGGKS